MPTKGKRPYPAREDHVADQQGHFKTQEVENLRKLRITGKGNRYEVAGRSGGMLMDRKHCPFLEERRIVITRAAHQAGGFGNKLQQCGARVFYLPLIRIEPSQNVRCPDAPDSFDWLVVTSVNGVHYLNRCFLDAGRSLRNMARCRIAAIGKATADALAEHGLSADVVPERHVADALIKELLMTESSPQGKRVLLAQGDKAGKSLGCALELRGMRVTSLICYENKDCPPTPEETASLVAFAPDAVTFFSPSAVKVFCSARLPEILTQASRTVIYASIGPVTTASMKGAGLAPIIEASRQSEDNLLEVLNNYFEGK